MYDLRRVHPSSRVLCPSPPSPNRFYSRRVFLFNCQPAPRSNSEQTFPSEAREASFLTLHCTPSVKDAAPSDASQHRSGNRRSARKVDTRSLPAALAGPLFRMCCFNFARTEPRDGVWLRSRGFFFFSEFRQPGEKGLRARLLVTAPEFKCVLFVKEEKCCSTSTA